jgi:hypothetical protein
MYFPFNRKTYPGIKGPLFDDEIQNAMNGLYTLANAILGLGPSDFAILSGFSYTSGSPGHYSGGLVYMSGKIYYSVGGVNVGQYLAPITTSIENKPHGDGVSRDTYEEYLADFSNIPATGGSPIFTTNMDAYRLSILLAKNVAIATAAADATTKANTAQANAIAATQITDHIGDVVYNYATTIQANRNNAYHDLDLSAIVPANRMAIINVDFVATTGLGATLLIRKKGDTHKSVYAIAANGGEYSGIMMCFVDNNSILQYNAGANMSLIGLFTVIGYL